MQLPGRRPAPPAGDAPAAADAEQQAARYEDGALSHQRRRAVVALGLSALLVVAVLVVARARRNGDIVALGFSPTSSTVATVADNDITGDPLFEGSQVIAPGDPTAPGAGPAGGPLEAASGADPATAAAATQPAVAAGAGVVIGGVGGEAGGIPPPTTRPGSDGGSGTTTPTTTGGGDLGTTTTTTAPGPPPASCSVSEASATPNPVSAQGQSGKLDENVTLRFRPSSCGTSFWIVGPGGLNIPTTGSPDGSFSATILEDDNRGWQPEQTYVISIRDAATAQIGTVDLRVVK